MRISDQEANRLHVLKTIRRAEPVARTEVARLAGFSNSLISDIVADLVSRQILLEARAPAAGRGRPRIQLMLNPEAAYVVGAYFAQDRSLGVEICNMRGDKVFGRLSSLERSSNLDDLAGNLASGIEQALAQSGFAKSRIHSVGVALPATVDALRGMVHWFTTVSAEPTPLAAMIERRLGLPVTIENSIDVMARAEHWFGQERQVDDFSLFAVGLNIGFSQYVDGFLRSGMHGVNSEFFHVKVGPLDGPTCVCGARGCLGVSATVFGAVLRICELRGLPPPELGDVLDLFATFAREANSGDRSAREAFDHAGRMLGVAVANHINMTDPARAVVLATEPVFADLIVAPFYAALQENTFSPFRGKCVVQFKVAEEVRWSHGAAALVLEQLYRASALDRFAAPAGA